MINNPEKKPQHFSHVRVSVVEFWSWWGRIILELRLKVSQFGNSPQLLLSWFRPGGVQGSGGLELQFDLFHLRFKSHHTCSHSARILFLPNVCHSVDFSIQIRAVLASRSKQIVPLHQKPGHCAGAAGWRNTWCHGCAASSPVDKTREWFLHKARDSCQSGTSRQPQQEVRNLPRHV